MLALDCPSILATLLLGIFAGGVVAGFAGFGLAAAAGAVLLHAMPAATAVPLMMLSSVVAQAIGLLVLRKTLDPMAAMPFIVGALPMLPVAALILLTVDPDIFRRAFGVFLIVYGAYTLTKSLSRPTARPDVSRPPQPGRWTRHAVGGIAGLIGGLTAMPGAVLTIWADARRADKAAQRAVVQPFILAVQLLSLAILGTSGVLVQNGVPQLFMRALPALVAGTVLGLWLYAHVADRTFRIGVLGLLCASGIGMVVA